MLSKDYNQVGQAIITVELVTLERLEREREVLDKIDSDRYRDRDDNE
jgi:hypothetical protein